MKMESVPQAALCKESSIFIAESDALLPLVLNETLIVLADVCAAQGKFGEASQPSPGPLLIIPPFFPKYRNTPHFTTVSRVGTGAPRAAILHFSQRR
jgi:hypothetical protein